MTDQPYSNLERSAFNHGPDAGMRKLPRKGWVSRWDKGRNGSQTQCIVRAEADSVGEDTSGWARRIGGWRS